MPRLRLPQPLLPNVSSILLQCRLPPSCSAWVVILPQHLHSAELSIARRVLGWSSQVHFEWIHYLQEMWVDVVWSIMEDSLFEPFSVSTKGKGNVWAVREVDSQQTFQCHICARTLAGHRDAKERDQRRLPIKTPSRLVETEKRTTGL